jgi:fructose-1,6-bisphosphatase/inositol monophosphatase family enzyme
VAGETLSVVTPRAYLADCAEAEAKNDEQGGHRYGSARGEILDSQTSCLVAGKSSSARRVFGTRREGNGQRIRARSGRTWGRVAYGDDVGDVRRCEPRGSSFSMNAESLVECLETLEPIFVQAGQTALRMQGSVNYYNKLQTGNPAVDIVTEADLATQEAILTAMRSTPLVECRLLAEEDTETVKAFAPESNFYIGIDPIDGTAVYARGGEHFSTIISLHDGEKFLYMFIYFPAWDWTVKIARGKYTSLGSAPNLSMFDHLQKTVVYWSGKPKANIPEEILSAIKAKGLEFRKMSSLGIGIGTIELFTSRKIAGVYYENMNVYDGCAEYVIASSRGQPLYSNSASGNLQLSHICKSEKGNHYPGYYLVLTNPVK